MPNAQTHRSFAKVTAHLIRHAGFAPGAARWLGSDLDQFIDASALPDQVNEVAVHVPGEGPTTSIFGKNLASCEHFQPGYRLADDPSLSVAAALAEGASALACMRVVTVDTDGTLPPLSGLLEPTPMQAAVIAQPGATLGSFRFPAASETAEYYARAALYWAGEGNAAGWRRCAGYALHLVHDTCIPHHAWGALLYGHQLFEDALEAEWARTIAETIEAGLVDTELARAVRRELADVAGETVAELCIGNAAWSRRLFGEPHDLADCPGDVALRVSVRAVASSIRAVEMMTGG